MPDGKFHSDWPFTIYSQKKSTDLPKEIRTSETIKLAAKSCKHILHWDILIGNFCITLEEIPLISKIIRSVEPKLSYHLQLDRNLRNFKVNGKCTGWRSPHDKHICTAAKQQCFSLYKEQQVCERAGWDSITVTNYLRKSALSGTKS